MCVTINWLIVGPGNGLSPARRKAFFWTITALSDELRNKILKLDSQYRVFYRQNAFVNVVSMGRALRGLKLDLNAHGIQGLKIPILYVLIPCYTEKYNL